MKSRWTIILSSALVIVALPALAQASWNANAGSGNGYSKAYSMSGGNQPTASVSGRNVTVSWSATGGDVPVAGYTVKRFTVGGVQQTILSNCTGTVSGTSCTENDVPPGTWRYSVTPVRQNWQGTESAQSANATVGSPSFTMNTSNVNSLPLGLTGTITNYLSGQAVTFRLDNPTTGTVLTGSITPSTVPSTGTAAVNVTLPAGIPDGAHTVYAIGSGGDVVGFALTVNLPCVAGGQTLVATDDSWVDQSSPTTNYGLDSTLKLRSKSGSQNARILVRLPAMPTIPAGCNLTTATLRLYNKSPVTGRTIQALRVDPTAPNWTENGVTWNNQPATTGTASTLVTTGTAGLMNWNVLTQVQAMYSATGGVTTNKGFLLRDATENAAAGPEQQFDSAEVGTPANHPRLILAWTD